jgi:ribonuclease P protein component
MLIRFFYAPERSTSEGQKFKMAKRFTLGKDQRLKSRKRIERIFREGKSINVFPYRVYYMMGDGYAPGGAAYALQAGFGASSRHFKKAVDRNRIKRLTREAYRLNKGGLGQVVEQRKLHLSLFFIYTGKELPDHRLVSGKIAVALEKIVKEIGS